MGETVHGNHVLSQAVALYLKSALTKVSPNGGGDAARDRNGMIMGKEEEEEEEEEIVWNLQRVRRFLTRRGQLLGRVCEKGCGIQAGFVPRCILE